jgi:hypothetical protein
MDHIDTAKPRGGLRLRVKFQLRKVTTFGLTVGAALLEVEVKLKMDHNYTNMCIAL